MRTVSKKSKTYSVSVADLGSPLRGAPTPGEGALRYISIKYFQKTALILEFFGR